MFELGARPHPAKDLYRAYLDQSHIFIGIYGKQYGWVAPGEEISGLEDEYRLGREKPRLIYIKDPGATREPGLSRLLRQIRDRDGISYKYFASAEELEELIQADLSLLLSERFELSVSRETGRGETERPERREEVSEPEQIGRAAGRLPAPLTSLVGREREIEEAGRMLERGETRLLTLTGPGGSGKTRLAIEAARRYAGRFDAVCYVELAPITDPQLVADEVARALGIREAGSATAEQRVLAFLRDLHVLLVFDNFEQVVSAAPFIARVLEQCPGVRALATSRIALNLRAEAELPVPPLELPEAAEALDPDKLAGRGALAMFRQRARAVRPDFELTAENVAAVAEICRRLDGLPLAIELAAPRIRLLPPAVLLERLQESFSVLTGGAADLPERQRTMKRAVAWSYELLEDREARLCRLLSVFRGGCSLPAIQAMCKPDGDLQGEAVDIAEALVAKNMAYQREDALGRPRLHMLETIREFTRERLAESGEEQRILEAHAAFFTDLAEEADPHLTSGRRDPWVRRLEIDLDNLRAVMRRSRGAAVDPLYGIRTAGTLGWFWHLRGHLSEGRSWADSLMKMPEAAGRSRERAKILFPAGGLAWSQGDYQACRTLLSESADIFREIGDKQGLMNAQAILSGGLASLGEYDRALELCEQTARLMRESEDHWGLAFILLWYGDTTLVRSGDTSGAGSMFRESLKLAEELEDDWLRAEALNHLGVAEGLLGRPDAACRYFEEGLSYHERTADRWALARGASGQAEVLLQLGDHGKAEELYLKSLSVWQEMGNRPGCLVCLSGLARVCAAEGRAVGAARLFGAAPRPVRTIGYLFLNGDSREYAKALEPARRQLGKAGWEAERRRGEAMVAEQTVLRCRNIDWGGAAWKSRGFTI